MKILVARHGESAGNKAHVVQGSRDPPLTARGRREARALGRLLSKERITVAYSSPLKRALETARIASPVPVTTERSIHENLMGKLEGMTHERVEEVYPHLFDKFFDNPSYRMPGGESLRDVQARIAPFLKMLYRKHADDVVLVVAHNTLNRVLLATLAGIPLERCRVIKQKNACLATLYVSPARVEFYALNNDLHKMK